VFGMLSEKYREDIVNQIETLRELLVAKRDPPHTVDDFERVRFRSYSCKRCKHNIGKQQLVALYHLERALEVIEVESRVELDEFGDEVDIVHRTD